MNLRADYRNEGYAIAKGLISEDQIDELLDALEGFKHSNKLYYSQSVHNWRAAKEDIDDFGLLKYSMENFTKLAWAGELGAKGRLILQGREIEFALRRLSENAKSFGMWQNMLFDKSTETVDHIDSWYLDTEERGGVIGAWVALEDITKEGGAFRVYPRSHRLNSFDIFDQDDHKKYISDCAAWKDFFKGEELYVKKGDVIFWNSLLVHGSSKQMVKGASRKSLTAHYFGLEQKRRGFSSNRLRIEDYRLPIVDQSCLRERVRWSMGGLVNYKMQRRNRERLVMNARNY